MGLQKYRDTGGGRTECDTGMGVDTDHGIIGRCTECEREGTETQTVERKQGTEGGGGKNADREKG